MLQTKQEVSAPAAKLPDDPYKRLISQARAEARVVAVTSMGPEVGRAITKAFQDKFGIELEWLSMRGQETAVKLQTERRSGVYTADIVIGGGTTLNTVLAPSGFLDPIETALFLPEVTEAKVWWDGRLPLIGAGYGFSIQKYVEVPLAINEELAKPEEIKSYNDLLNPKWKGKIVMDDPTVTGLGGKLASYIIKQKLAGGEEFLRSLVKQEPVITRDRRLLSEWLARGKYTIAIGARAEMTTVFIEMGSPIKFLNLGEGTFVTSGGGMVSLVNKAMHPSAARLFANWILTREAGTIWAKASAMQSARNDVPTDFLDAAHVRQPGVKYFDGDLEEFEKELPGLFAISRGIFAPVMR